MTGELTEATCEGRMEHDPVEGLSGWDGGPKGSGPSADSVGVPHASAARAKEEAGLDIDSWIEGYGRAWREKDDRAVGALFTERALYASHPLEPPHRGREEIRAYWRLATATQQDLVLRFGEPVFSGRRAAVEWWATMRDGEWAAKEAGDDRITHPGCLVLRFAADGLCEELREYWNVGFGPPVRPPEGWGG